jgi:hypothetical protein
MLLPGTLLRRVEVIDEEAYIALLSKYGKIKTDADSTFELANFRSADAPVDTSPQKLPFAGLLIDLSLPQTLHGAVQK